MFHRRRNLVRAGFLLACSLTLGCQAVGPREAAAPHAAAAPGPMFATAPAIVARAAPADQADIRQVAFRPATAGGEPATQWRPVQRPEELPGDNPWKTVQHVGDAAVLAGPFLNASPPQTVPPVGMMANGHPPFSPEPPPVHVPPGGVPFETKQVSLPPYRIGPPDILLVESTEGLEKVQPVRGQHLVRPDGTIALGVYGSVYVHGMTCDQAREAVSRLIYARKDPEGVVTFEKVLKGTNVDVIAYNSQVYYVITDGAGLGQQVVPIPVTGRETVLDALAKINGLSPVSSKRHIWVARRAGDGVVSQQKLDVDWIGITERGDTRTNYQIMPGDRVFVQSDRVRLFDNTLAKFLSPVERLFGVTLLSSQAINSIRSGSVTGVR